MRYLVPAVIVLLALGSPVFAAEAAGRCGTGPQTAAEVYAQHRYARGRDAITLRTLTGAADHDANHVAILEDRGDLVSRRNPFDLDGAALRFVPNQVGGFDGVRLAPAALEPVGPPIGLGDDDAQGVDLPFAFPFYGARYDRLFIHSDGHLTFGSPDVGSAQRGLARFLSGPPRIAAFFADLDPSRGGSITQRVTNDRAVFSWSEVPGGGQINRNSFQIAIAPSGVIEFVYGTQLGSREALVGVSPGGTSDLTPADLSEGRPTGSTGALAERFSETERVDLLSVARRFYAGHPDLFDQLVVYTTRPLNPLGGSLAFEINVRNDVRGIGLPELDDSREWGSAGRLSSIVFMDSIDTYLDVDGFEILGHEVGHRWLSQLRFRLADGRVSSALLGRGEVHWSFFLDTDASVMEGNDIDVRGGGRFETSDITRRYSPLDQYAMGLRDASEVPPFFYVNEPDNFRPNRPYKASSTPEAGVSFTGIRTEVRIEQVVAAMGTRLPEASRAQRVLRQAYILVADTKAPATAERTAAVARIRARFELFFREATEGRGVADTTFP